MVKWSTLDLPFCRRGKLKCTKHEPLAGVHRRKPRPGSPHSLPARLGLPCPQSRPARLPSGTWLPAPACTTALAASASLTGDSSQTCFEPFSGLSEDPFPALMNSHTLCFFPDLCCHVKHRPQPRTLWGNAGYPQEGTGSTVSAVPHSRGRVEKFALKVRKKVVNHNSSKLLFTNISLRKDFFNTIICEMIAKVWLPIEQRSTLCLAGGKVPLG